MPTPQSVVDLVARFKEHYDTYTSGDYKEASLRQEFLNPLLAALGWDITNKDSYAEPYRDVIIEESVKSGMSSRAPDYTFRIGGTPKFYVEAKKPSLDLK